MSMSDGVKGFTKVQCNYGNIGTGCVTGDQLQSVGVR